VPPFAIAWPTTGHVIIGGCDKRILVYDKDGKVSQTFDFSRDPDEREFTVACNSPSGQSAAFGSYNKYSFEIITYICIKYKFYLDCG
jgi:intraflagellar transport protein 172